MSTKIFTLEQVQEHNKKDDAYIIIDNFVYDITKFAALHPGGTKVILDLAGQNATQQFHYFHNQKVLSKYHDKLVVGQLQEDPKKTKKKVQEVPQTKNGFGELVPMADPNWYQGWNSPYYNESHTKFRDAVRKYVIQEFAQNVHQWDEDYKIPQEVYQKAGDHGILQGNAGVPWETKYYGDLLPGGIKPEEFDFFHMLILISEVVKGTSAGFFWGFAEGLQIGLPPILHFGSDYLKQKICRDCLFGRKNICLAITEPQAGSDVAGITTTAKLTPDGKYYIVNGIKKWITNGIFSDYFTTAVVTGKEKGMNSVSLLVIEKTMPGVKTKRMKCQGMWASGTTYITLEDVKVPVENLIGKENEGFKYIMSNFNYERFGFCVQATACARVCYEEAFKFAHKRKTFGKQLVEHPVIRHKLANMIRQIEVCHAYCENIAFQLNKMTSQERIRYLAGPIALAKAQCTIVLEYCAREAVQIFGGLGYTRGGQGEKVERIYREVRGLAIPGGSEEIMLDLGIKQAMKYYPPDAKL